MSFSKEFENAKSNLELLKNDPGNDAKLELYALYKQASIGNCNVPKPGFTDVVNKYKWNAWNDLKNMSKNDAEKNYIKLVNQLLEKEGITPKKTETKFCDGILTSVEFGNVYKIVLNRPEKLNSITAQMYADIPLALKEAEEDSNIVLVVITGNGDFFSSGNDLSNYMKETDNPEAEIIKGSAFLENYVNAFINFTKPIIGLINGPCIGISFTIIGLFDLVISSDKATFHAPFTGIALSPEGCSSYTFPRLMGQIKASEILLFNRKLNAQEAFERNLVNEIIPHGQFTKLAWEKIEKISQLSPKSLVASKFLIRSIERDKLLEVNRKEVDTLVNRLKSGDFMESVMNFMSKKSKL